MSLGYLLAFFVGFFASPIWALIYMVAADIKFAKQGWKRSN